MRDEALDEARDKAEADRLARMRLRRAREPTPFGSALGSSLEPLGHLRSVYIPDMRRVRRLPPLDARTKTLQDRKQASYLRSHPKMMQAAGTGRTEGAVVPPHALLRLLNSGDQIAWSSLQHPRRLASDADSDADSDEVGQHGQAHTRSRPHLPARPSALQLLRELV